MPPNPDIALTAYSDFYNTIYRKTDSFTPITQSARAVPTQTYTSYTISDFLILAFAALGNVNYAGGYGDTQGWYTTDRVINLIEDLARIANSLTSRYTDTWGTGSGQYNPDADINRDGAVNVIDLGIAGANFGQSMG